MKRLLLVVLVFLTSITFGQFKKDIENPISIRDGVFNDNPSGLLLDFLGIEDFSMNHSVEMSYSSGAGQGVALGVYTNSMAFKFSDKLQLEVDASMVNSPYSSFGKDHMNQINGIYLSRAELKYKISDDAHLHIQYQQIPNGLYSPYGYGFYPFSRSLRSDPFRDFR
ncbi:MAG: hypothetical protein JEY94_10265 [Melioribacteraceae bacterium]|nr:hypothetical protein [Melioribacteraceae bacterium]